MSDISETRCLTDTQVSVQRRTASSSQEDEAHQPELNSGPSRRREERSPHERQKRNSVGHSRANRGWAGSPEHPPERSQVFA